METYLNKGIKEIIDEFPEVEGILNRFGIGCGPCSVGTCLLKDIVDIHDLPAEQEREMMTSIAQAINPHEPVKIPKMHRKMKPESKKINYSPPMKTLVDEHVLIKRWVALIPTVVENLDLDSDEGRRLIRKGIDFIRSYADRFHHAKEEEILFKYFDENSDILKVMHEDHTNARSHVAAMLQALDNKNKAALAEHLLAYGELLSEHIKKEDEILYPWMDRNLSITQVGEIFSKFNEVDNKMVESARNYEAFVDNIEKEFI